MSANPLQRYFRRPALWVKLPTLGKWYQNNEVRYNENFEVQVYGITAIDEILINTPDALFNGHALESVIRSCIPEVHDIKSLLQPDLEALFLGIKSASSNGKYEITRTCKKCTHENTFDLNCNHLLDSMRYLEDSDAVVNVGNDIKVHVKPYDFDMRSLFIKRQLEERKTLSLIENDTEIDDNLLKASKYAKSLEEMTKLTFRLMSESIVAVEILGRDAQYVTDKDHISEWMLNVNKQTASSIIEAVNALNALGPQRSTTAVCQNCSHTWEESLNFDPTVFFTQR